MQSQKGKFKTAQLYKSVYHQEGHFDKRFDIQGVGQEMAVMVG